MTAFKVGDKVTRFRSYDTMAWIESGLYKNNNDWIYEVEAILPMSGIKLLNVERKYFDSDHFKLYVDQVIDFDSDDEDCI